MFLSANPVKIPLLQLDEEYRAIENKIRAAKFREKLRFRSCWAARPDDLLQALHEDVPTVLHFSGHGAGVQGLCFLAEDGGVLCVNSDGLGQVIRATGDSIQLVVLNACYTKVQADVLVAHVPCVIGMPSTIGDKSAIVYASELYRALAFGKSVANAHQWGLAALALHSMAGNMRDIDTADIDTAAAALRTAPPELLVRVGVDPSDVYIVQGPQPTSAVPASSGEARTHLEIHIDGDLEMLDAGTLSKVVSELCRLIGGRPVTILCVTKGSIRLCLSFDAEAARTLMSLRHGDRLNEINGLRVSDVVELGQDITADLPIEVISSFESIWNSLSPQAQLVLQLASTFVTVRFPLALVAGALKRIGCDPEVSEDAINEVRIHQLAARSGEDLQVHPLIAQYVRGRAPLDEALRKILFQGLLHCARKFPAHPLDPECRALMLAHSLHVEDWAAVVTDGSACHSVGCAIFELGQFVRALPWFMRAVAAKEKGDIHGQVDPEDLGTSLHEIGACYANQGQFAEALPWFMRAVAAKEKGDIHGQVDSASLGASLHQVGVCHANQGQFAEALPPFARALAAKEKGDVHGRIDSEELGMSLHGVGFCYASQGQFAEALPWFERAVAANEKGDVHGRIDPESLGTSLHGVGFCCASQGQFAEALPWFERAVAAKEKGDVHGRVDSESLGTSLHGVGFCYASQDQFVEARPWFERAVAVKEKGDMHGRVDSESLGTSLHGAGFCYKRQGQFAQALRWFERAVAAKEKGDMHGRHHSESLGASLHQMGICYASQDQFAQALPWFERAVAAAEKGDVRGRVDPASLGASLHGVAVCYASQGQFAQALPWFERAVAAKKKGDVHGRVDPESLAASVRGVNVCYRNRGRFAKAKHAEGWLEQLRHGL